jgi:DNA-binding winged helix-turn-helix (wHTH) protein
MDAMLALASDVDAPVASPELARRIWPGNAMVTPYDVRRVVHRLRVLLRSNRTPVRIRNVHGVGYGLELDQPGEPRPRSDRRSPPTPNRAGSGPGHIQDISRTTSGVGIGTRPNVRMPAREEGSMAGTHDDAVLFVELAK